jgi:MarR family transcriptional regulator, lower aerobic nicotinate degradation pathway regulator
MPAEELPSRPPVLLRLPVFALSRLGQTARAGAKAAFDREGLSWRAHVVLLCLHEHGDLSQRDLAGLISMDPSDLVRLLDEMQRAGHLRRRPDPRDRRRYVVSITADGTDALHQGERIMDRATDEVLAPLTPDERETLNALVLRALDISR